MFRAHALAQGACEILVCALKLFANQQTGRRQLSGYALRGSAGSDRIEDRGWAEEVQRGGQSRSTDGRRLAEEFAGNQSGRAPLRQRNVPERGCSGRGGRIDTTKRCKRFSALFRGGTQRSFIDTAKVEAGRWAPPLVCEDWHAVCQAIHNSVEGAVRGESALQVRGNEQGSQRSSP